MNTDQMTAVHNAVETLYAVFARYPLRLRVEGCPCCVFAEDQDRIHGKPLRELAIDDLERFGWKAMTTWGDVDDFRHFLPRLLELSAYDRFPYGPDPLIGKLVYARWRTWPGVEQHAIETYFVAVWQAVLATFPSHVAVPSFADASIFLRSVGDAMEDLTPFLASWQLSTMPALLHLARFLSDATSAHLDKAGLPDLFGNARHGQHVQVLQWLAHCGAQESLEQAFFDQATAPYADDLAAAADYLRWLSLAPLSS